MAQEKDKTTWTAEEIRAMLIQMMDTDTSKYDMLVEVHHIRKYFTDHGINMFPKTVEVY